VRGSKKITNINLSKMIGAFKFEKKVKIVINILLNDVT